MNKYQDSIYKIEQQAKNIKERFKETKAEIRAEVILDKLEALKELAEKEIPKEPIYEGDGYADGYMVYDNWGCPNCGEVYEVDGEKFDRCPKCGQKIDWSEEE